MRAWPFLLLFVSTPARADATAAAEDLFQRGKARMAANDPEGACPLFAESYRLDPAGGTLQNLAFCHEQLGHWATAYARFEELRAMSKTATPPRLDRVRLADEHIAAIAPKLSRIVVEAASEDRVTIDGTTYGTSAWVEGIVVDPGPHALVAEAAGKKPFRASVSVDRDASRVVVRVPPLDPEPTEPIAVLRTVYPTRNIGVALAGAGGLALAAGAITGALAIAANARGRDLCSRDTNGGAPVTDFDPSGRCYDDSGARADANHEKDRARTFATAADVLVPLGVVAVGVGVTLIFRRSIVPAPHGLEARF